VFRVNVLPTIGLQGAPLSGAAPLTVAFTATAADPDGDPLTVTWNFGDGTTATGTGPQTHRYQNAGSFTAIVTVSDGFATAQATVIVTVAAGGGGVPPDPKTVAPPIDPTVASSLKDATNFLYTGANPIQTGVAPGTIDPVRVAVLRGRVLDRNN